MKLKIKMPPGDMWLPVTVIVGALAGGWLLVTCRTQIGARAWAWVKAKAGIA
jgi:hypothetical protein